MLDLRRVSNMDQPQPVAFDLVVSIYLTPSVDDSLFDRLNLTAREARILLRLALVDALVQPRLDFPLCGTMCSPRSTTLSGYSVKRSGGEFCSERSQSQGL